MIFDICRDIWIYGGGNVEDFSLLGGGNVEDLGGGNVEWITLMSPFFTDYIGTFQTFPLIHFLANPRNALS